MDPQKFTEFGALKNIDIFDPSVLFALVVAGVGDMTFYLVVTRWVAAIFVAFLLFPKITGFMPKLILGIALVLAIVPFMPLPVLVLGIALAVLLSNKLIEYTVIAAILVVEAAVAVTGAGAVADVAVDAAATAVKEAGEKVVEKGVEKVVQKGAEKVVEKGAQKVAEKGAEKAVQKGAEKTVEKGAQKTLGQKAREYGRKKVREKLEDRRDELHKELFNNKGRNKDASDEDAFAGSGESQVEPVVDLRSWGSGAGGGPENPAVEDGMDRAA